VLALATLHTHVSIHRVARLTTGVSAYSDKRAAPGQMFANIRLGAVVIEPAANLVEILGRSPAQDTVLLREDRHYLCTRHLERRDNPRILMTCQQSTELPGPLPRYS
jgi:hypothetical protein